MLTFWEKLSCHVFQTPCRTCYGFIFFVVFPLRVLGYNRFQLETQKRSCNSYMLWIRKCHQWVVYGWNFNLENKSLKPIKIAQYYDRKKFWYIYIYMRPLHIPSVCEASCHPYSILQVPGQDAFTPGSIDGSFLFKKNDFWYLIFFPAICACVQKEKPYGVWRSAEWCVKTETSHRGLTQEMRRQEVLWLYSQRLAAFQLVSSFHPWCLPNFTVFMGCQAGLFLFLYFLTFTDL